MSRAARRASRPTSSRSRRTPVRPQKSGGLEIPWVPIAIVVLIVAIVGIVAYLVWQSTKPPAKQYAKARAYEENQMPDKPGEWVDLPTDWGDGTNQAHYANDNGPNTNSHVTHDVDYSKETSPSSANGLPPVGGPHWGQGSCGDDPKNAPSFCGPVPWGIYRDPWPAESVVHNMEHGGVIVWYNLTDTGLRDQIEAEVERLGKKGAFIVMTPYPDVPAETIWFTSWSRRELVPADQYDKSKLDEYISDFNCAFNPEGFKCGNF